MNNLTKDELIMALCEIGSLTYSEELKGYFITESRDFTLTDNELRKTHQIYLTLQNEKSTDLTDNELYNIPFKI